MPFAYAVLSLTVVRMAPVALAMIGTHLRRDTVALMGWFGPRGLASVVLGLIYLEQLEEFSANHAILFTVIATVTLSILAHGVSAAPATKWYAQKVANLGPDAPECAGELGKADEVGNPGKRK